MTHYAVDDVGEGVARLERDDGRVFLLPVDLLPPGTRSGDVLGSSTCVAGDRSLTRWWRDEAERRRRVERARAILDRLSAEDDGADIAL